MPEQVKPQPQQPTSLPPEPVVVASAPPAVKLTPEGRKQRFAELRKRMGRSQIAVVPPAGKIGYWAPLNDSREMGRLDWLGCKVVHESDPKRPLWRANGLKADGTYVIGDVILMECDEETWGMLQEEYLNVHEAMMTNTKATFIQDAAQVGVPAFETAKK